MFLISQFGCEISLKYFINTSSTWFNYKYILKKIEMYDKFPCPDASLLSLVLKELYFSVASKTEFNYVLQLIRQKSSAQLLRFPFIIFTYLVL